MSARPTALRRLGRPAAAGLLCAFAALSSTVTSADAAAFDTTLVSRATGHDGSGATNDSGVPSTSADGRYVAFASEADNLSTADDNAFSNIFVRDTLTGATTLISRAPGPLGAGASGNSYDPSISADGRHVAFESHANNLSNADDDNHANVFVRDRITGATVLISRQTGQFGAAANDESDTPSISTDGRHVAFESHANNLSGADNDNYANIFVRDTLTGTTTLISRAPGHNGAGANDNSSFPSISADGRHVAFSSQADNLSADDNVPGNIFVRDTLTGDTTLVSRASGQDGAGADGNSNLPSISADGRQIAFYSHADNLSAADDNAHANIFVRDRITGATTLISRASGQDGAGANESSFVPSISADGRQIAFYSHADNLSAADDDALSNIFVRDTLTGTTTLISRAPGHNGAGANGDSGAPSISADGRHVAFQSYADNLSAVDDNAFANVFIRDTGPRPACSDGLDNDADAKVDFPADPGCADAADDSEDSEPKSVEPGGEPSLALTLSAKKRQKLTRPLRIKLRATKDAQAKVKAKVKIAGVPKKLKLKSANRALTANQTTKLRLRAKPKTKRALKTASKAKVRIVATATDAQGDRAQAARRVKLR